MCCLSEEVVPNVSVKGLVYIGTYSKLLLFIVSIVMYELRCSVIVALVWIRCVALLTHSDILRAAGVYACASTVQIQHQINDL